MASNDMSARDRLDRMLSEGQITREDYERLAKAMIRLPEPEEESAPASRERGKLSKSWEDGVIGGLCAGYAHYFGVDANVIRTLFIVAVILLSAITGIGLALIPLYFAFCAMVPWDEKEKADAFHKSGRVGLFMVAVAGLYFILPLIYSVTVLPKLEHHYEQIVPIGLDFWSPQNQGAIPGRALDCAREYRQWLQLNDGMIIWGLGIVVLVTLFMGTVYASLCKPLVRRGFALIILGFGVAWVVFLVAGTLYPFVSNLQWIR